MKHWLSNYGFPKRVGTDSMLEKARTGDVDARNDFVMHHVRLGLHRVMKYSIEHVDDLVSVMFCSILKATDKLIVMNHPNPTGYVMKYVKNDILKFLTRQRIFGPSPETVQRRNIHVKRLNRNPNLILQQSQNVSFEFFECLNLSMQTDLEREVISLRIKGYSDIEISDKLDISRQNVYRIRSTVENRFMEKYDVRKRVARGVCSSNKQSTN